MEWGIVYGDEGGGVKGRSPENPWDAFTGILVGDGDSTDQDDNSGDGQKGYILDFECRTNRIS